MLVGLAIIIRAHDVVPRGGVTILAQITAGTFGTGWPFYVSNLAVTLVLGLAANTSFGGLPVLMSLLARDHRLPHLFYLRAERPVYRQGIAALALAAMVLLIVVQAETSRLIPLFTIGVFIGFTISQLGLVRHWRQERPPHWRTRAVLNGVGAAMTGVAVAVFLFTKFREGAWVVTITVPMLTFLFAHTESYYAKVASELKLGLTPRIPHKSESVVIVPTSTVNLLTEQALSAALSIGDHGGGARPRRRRGGASWGQARMGRVEIGRAARGAGRPATPSDTQRAPVRRLDTGGWTKDHRPDPRDHPQQAPPRDPAQQTSAGASSRRRSSLTRRASWSPHCPSTSTTERVSPDRLDPSRA